MKYAIVTVPAAAVRKKPDHRKEMSNQLLFGETVKVLKQKSDRWLKVESLYDGYTGWLTTHLVTGINKPVPKEKIYLAPHLLTKIYWGAQTVHIPTGAVLPDFKDQKGAIAGKEYILEEAPLDPSAVTDKAGQLVQNAMAWLNAPYLWGGKTILGVDCSGFSQVMYKLIGIAIARDAWQQAQQGRLIKDLAKALPGDLAFFDDKDEIVHVGILLGPGSIIHAAGKVRIDRIDKKGIINTDTGKRTHYLKLIRRFF
ncbi:MAG: C40 family peptidase [Niabella sp.]